MRMTGCLRAAWRPLARRYPARSIWSRAPGSCRIWLKLSVLLIGPKLRNRSKLSSVKLYERSRALGNVFFSVLCHSLFKHLYLYQYGLLHGPVTSGRTGSLTKIVNWKPSRALGAIYHSGLSRKSLFRGWALNRQETVLIKVIFTWKGTHTHKKNQ